MDLMEVKIELYVHMRWMHSSYMYVGMYVYVYINE